MRQQQELAGKVALVTGGSRNIGRAIALDLAAGGAAVVVNTRRSREAAEAVAAEIEAAGGRAMAALADVTDEAAVSAMIEHGVERFGRLDILVNNAALRPAQRLETLSLADYRAVLALILEAPFLCAKAALAHLRRSGEGAIISIGGMTGHVGGADRLHVAAGKAGLVGLTKGLARELAPDRITANCVVPGLIDTPRAHTPSAHAANPALLGRLGTVAEIAAMVRYLAGPAARFITGQTIHVNGGAYMP
ncbi:MAG TPA: SDR family oxidoreductase [Stellaceae bacterium]|nr:SDR family oxidoreductase [Stellaceae bacterium]